MDDLVDLTNKEAVKEIIKSVNGIILGGRSYRDSIFSRRESCSIRGYHRISREPQDHKTCTACYDCDLFFAPDDGVNYRVVHA